MKRLLCLSAAALIATAATAHATSATSSTTTQTTTTKSTTVAPIATAQQFTLKDGTLLMVSGTSAYTIDTTGTKVPAIDGDHELADSKSITTKGGMIVGGLPEQGSPAAAVSTTVMTPSGTTTYTSTAPAAGTTVVTPGGATTSTTVTTTGSSSTPE